MTQKQTAGRDRLGKLAPQFAALKAEVFDELQKAVLNSLPHERQEPIHQGCPVIVIDMETGDRISAFNMKNVKPDKYQMESFARSILDMMMKDMAEKKAKENK